MSLVSEIVSCRSMDFENQRRVFVRRDQGWKWHEIQNVVRTLQNEKPSETQCREVYNGFNRRLGRKNYNFVFVRLAAGETFYEKDKVPARKPENRFSLFAQTVKRRRIGGL